MFNVECSRIIPPPSTITRTSLSQIHSTGGQYPLVAQGTCHSHFYCCPAFQKSPLGKCLPQSPRSLIHLSFNRTQEYRPFPKQASAIPHQGSHLISFLQEWSAPYSVPKSQQGSWVYQSGDLLRGPKRSPCPLTEDHCKKSLPFAVPLLKPLQKL